MATTLTLKNVPELIYLRLKASAEAHRRSINSEAILCLETVLTPSRVTADERLARARRLREALPACIEPGQLDADKRESRA